MTKWTIEPAVNYCNIKEGEMFVAQFVPRERAEEIIRTREEHGRMVEGLKEISKGEGAFNRNPMVHAENTIRSMKEIAENLLKEITE